MKSVSFGVVFFHLCVFVFFFCGNFIHQQPLLLSQNYTLLHQICGDDFVSDESRHKKLEQLDITSTTHLFFFFFKLSISFFYLGSHLILISLFIIFSIVPDQSERQVDLNRPLLIYHLQELRVCVA
jgi:hypothetical protein